MRWRDAFMRNVASLCYVESLFDRIADVVFSIKDRDGRYVAMSSAALRRCGLRSRGDALGKTAFDLFPRPMAERYARQDERLFRTRRPIVDNLDLTVYHDGSAGWCLTTKEPLLDPGGEVIGLACISRDLIAPNHAGLIDARFAATIDYVLEHFDQPLRVEELARRAGLSLAQFDRRMKKIFNLSVGQYLIKTRIDHAARLLATSALAIAEIAQRAGFADQSALARQFRQLTGLTPRDYRKLTQVGQ